MATILVACANGAGSSLLMKMAVEKVVKELNMNVSKIHHCSISEAKSTARQFTILFCPLNFKGMFESAEQAGTIVVGIRNVMSAPEIKEKVIELGLDQTFKK